MRRAWAIVLALAAAGCAPSEEEIKARFSDYVNGANACTMVSECATAGAGCPLGCVVAVRVERVADVEAKARALIKEYERGGTSCQYGCRPAGMLACVQNKCAVLYDQPGDAGASDLPLEVRP